MQGTAARDQWGALAISAYGGSWLCGHVLWAADDGVLLLPVPADAPIVVGSLVAPVDLEATDRQRLRDQLAAMVNSLALCGAVIDLPSLHECFRSQRSGIYLVRTRPA